MASTVWRGYISFGLISIPVRLFRAARAERVGLRRLYRAAPEPALPQQIPPQQRGPVPIRKAEREEATAPAEPILSPVRQGSIRSETDEVVAREEVVKGFEYEKGRYVPIEAEELKSIAPKTSTAMDIQEFVALPEIDPVYFETSYYVTPEEAGEKAYALLYRAMQSTQLVAIAQFAMHTREHVVVLRPGKSGLLAHTMFFASEVRADEEYHADLKMVAEKELDLAQSLIRSLAAPFEPLKYRDTYRERLESIIAGKVKGEPVAVAETTAGPAEVVDIADALRKSLAQLKKPVISEPRKPVKKAGRGSKG